jgi:hypothetical protein
MREELKEGRSDQLLVVSRWSFGSQQLNNGEAPMAHDD